MRERKAIGFKVVYDESANGTMDEKVSELLQQGWELHGRTAMNYLGGGGVLQCSQAMVKYEDAVEESAEIPRNLGGGGWTVEYDLLDKLSHCAGVSMEEAEAVIMAMVATCHAKLSNVSVEFGDIVKGKRTNEKPPT